MQAIISNAVQNYGRFTTISMGMTGIAAAEMAFCTVVDIVNGYNVRLNADLGGAIFYGLCAANMVPGTARMGALIFTGYSINTLSGNDYEQKNDYLASKVTRFPFYAVGEPVNNLSLPKHTVWVGVAILATAIAIYHLPDAYHAIMQG